MALNPTRLSRMKLRIAFSLCAILVVGIAWRIMPNSSVGDASEPPAAGQASEPQLIVWTGYSIVDADETQLAIGVIELAPTQGKHAQSEPGVSRTWTFLTYVGAEGEAALLTNQRVVLINDGQKDSYFEIEGVRVQGMDQLGPIAKAHSFDLEVALDEDPESKFVFACIGYQVDPKNAFFRELVSRPFDESIPPFTISFSPASLDLSFIPESGVDLFLLGLAGLFFAKSDLTVK